MDAHLKVDFSDTTGYGSSDHTSFTTKQVPVLFFFSGLHADYHKPSDTWDKIDAPAGAAAQVHRRGRHAAAGRRSPAICACSRPKPSAHGAPSAGSRSAGSGYGPYFGSIPDFAEVPTGVKFADVREGSPAGKAGLRGGDILIEFDSKPIQNLYDFTYALAKEEGGRDGPGKGTS